jgi:SAM-dependent methyltransferase
VTKQYDRAYFDRWYRGHGRVSSHAEVRRKVSLAVASTEYFLRRTIRDALDVGCGEGAWRSHLRALRPRVDYLGLDPSEYAVTRFGRTRNIHKATFGELPSLPLDVYDLVICSDVLHYVPDGELKAGVRALAEATDGVAYLEVLTKEDDIMGDLHGLIRRPAAFYRKLFTDAGLTSVGPYLWLGPGFRDAVAELEAAR